MKIFRPDEIGVLYRSFRFARRNTLAIGMLGLFRFGDGGRVAMQPEADLWAAVAAAMGEGAVLDDGYPKPAAEFFVYGEAHAAGAKPVREMQVSAQLGIQRKQLLVSGDRHFNAVGLISETTPFLSMPLTPAQAFGGAQHAANVLGKGAQVSMAKDGGEQWLLPNIESMGQRVANRGDVIAPLGFWAQDQNAPSRRSLLGEFNDGWLKNTWPYLPDDTHVEFFHAAPSDQRFQTYLQGDEAFELRGMHPLQQALTGRLPAVRARCFINRATPGGSERFSELETRLETVWLFPGLASGIVLYRAQSDVSDDDATDAMHLLVEWEDMRDAPASFEHYQKRFSQEREGGSGVDGVVADSGPQGVAMPGPATLAVSSAVASEVPDEVGLEPLASASEAIETLERHNAELMAKHGLSEKDLLAAPVSETVFPKVSIAEVEKSIAELEAENRSLMAKHNLTEADLAKAPVVPPEPSVNLSDVPGAVNDLGRTNKELYERSGLDKVSAETLAAMPSEAAQALRELRTEQAQGWIADDLRQVVSELVLPEIDPTEALALATLAPPVPGSRHAQLTREQVIERHAAKESLSGFDLSGIDLSKLDLAGADFSGSLLEGTIFAGSRLANANLSTCMMQGADCSEADFTGANLAEASAGGAKFAKARLPGAQLKEADFTGADFSEAQVQKAVLDGAIFEQAVMAKLQAAGASAVYGNFTGADLSGADFGQAHLAQAMFHESKLGAANFKAARCEAAEFYGADASGAQFASAAMDATRADAGSQFAQAVFDGAQLQRAAWEGAKLAGASFTGAALDDADFSQVKAVGAIFRQASARHAKFGKADLTKADLTGANLFKGSLRKTRVEDAVLHFANAYGADFEGTTIRAAALEGADIGQTILTFRPPLA